MRRVEIKQQIGTKAQKADHPLIDIMFPGPGHPVIQIDIHFVVGEAVRQGGRHGVGDPAIPLTVTRGKYRPAIGHFIVTQFTIQNQLVGCRRHAGRRRRDLIQKQDAFGAVTLGIRQHCRHSPFHRIAVFKRNPPQVAGLHL